MSGTHKRMRVREPHFIRNFSPIVRTRNSERFEPGAYRTYVVYSCKCVCVSVGNILCDHERVRPRCVDDRADVTRCINIQHSASTTTRIPFTIYIVYTRVSVVNVDSRRRRRRLGPVRMCVCMHHDARVRVTLANETARTPYACARDKLPGNQT